MSLIRLFHTLIILAVMNINAIRYCKCQLVPLNMLTTYLNVKLYWKIGCGDQRLKINYHHSSILGCTLSLRLGAPQRSAIIALPRFG